MEISKEITIATSKYLDANARMKKAVAQVAIWVKEKQAASDAASLAFNDLLALMAASGEPSDKVPVDAVAVQAVIK